MASLTLSSCLHRRITNDREAAPVACVTAAATPDTHALA